MFSGLVFGTSLFVPLRIQDGNPNEVYAAFLPLCALLIGLACNGNRSSLLLLPFVLYTMLSDGKLTSLMAIFYLGVLCAFSLIPGFGVFPRGQTAARTDWRPLKLLFVAFLTAGAIGAARILPALEFLHANGGLAHVRLFFYPDAYSVDAYKFRQLAEEIIGWKGFIGLATLGSLPVLFSLGCSSFRKWNASIGTRTAIFLRA